ncbi:glutamic acid-rich protein-like isoform X2 [Bombus pyrosoma]|nr:glutamic acid-rich protein-like isoform X2 [Bombus pyrosoma]XP_043585635.1 glutamic acid-rich protein-like isoform X2 [Bombus pyrosoma]
MIPNGRAAMEMTLRWLGRPDLAKYVRENPRLTKSLNTGDYDTADTLGFLGHGLSRRHASETGKNLRNHAKRKKKKKRKEKKKRVRHAHKEYDRNTQNKRVQKGMVAAAHTALYVWDENKKDKDTFTDCLEWNDEDVCACSDIEEACTGKCEIYDRNYQTHYVADHRICTDDSMKSVSCVHQPKKEEKKRQRFSFFQRSCQKKEKDQENRDRKKILENVAAKKCEKIPQIVQKDQCKCCRCTLNSKDRILREKREIRKWKARRKKEEKRRKKEESKRAKQLSNVCFKETCK